MTFSSSSSHAHFTLLVFELVNLCHTLGVTEGASVPLPPPIAFLESEGGVTPGIPFRAVIDGRFARRPASPFPVRATFGLFNPLGDVLLEKQV